MKKRNRKGGRELIEGNRAKRKGRKGGRVEWKVKEGKERKGEEIYVEEKKG